MNTPIAGCCTSHTQCTDGDPCTEDRCVLNQCSNENICECQLNVDCSDGAYCNGVEVCVGGLCQSGVQGPTCLLKLLPYGVIYDAPQRFNAGHHGQWIAGEGSGLVHRSRGSHHFHNVAAATEGPRLRSGGPRSDEKGGQGAARRGNRERTRWPQRGTSEFLEELLSGIATSPQ